MVRQWTPVCVYLLPNFTHFPRESGLRTALHRCDHHASVSLLHWRLCEESWAQIPCQFQACLLAEKVAGGVYGNIQLGGCSGLSGFRPRGRSGTDNWKLASALKVDGGKSVGHAMSG